MLLLIVMALLLLGLSSCWRAVDIINGIFYSIAMCNSAIFTTSALYTRAATYRLLPAVDISWISAGRRWRRIGVLGLGGGGVDQWRRRQARQKRSAPFGAVYDSVSGPRWLRVKPGVEDLFGGDLGTELV